MRRARDTVPIEVIRERLSYDPLTGAVTWRDYPGRKKVMPGQIAGVLTIHGYQKTCVNYKWIFSHRIAWALHYGEWPQGFIDHINGDRRDNRIENLRVATFAQNMRNRRTRGKSSIYKGVRYSKSARKWCVECGSYELGNHEYIGLFEDEKAAALAYNEAAIRRYGEFARINEVGE